MESADVSSLPSVCGSRSSRLRGSPCLRGATAGPRPWSACSSTASFACAMTSRCSHRATRARRRASSLPSRRRAVMTSGMTQPELLHALTCVRDGGSFDVVSDHTGALGLALSNLTSDAVPEHRARNARRRGGCALPQRLRSHPRRRARGADREPSGERARPAVGGLDPERHLARRPPLQGVQRRRVSPLARPHVARQGARDRDRSRARCRDADAARGEAAGGRGAGVLQDGGGATSSATASRTSARSICASEFTCCMARGR